MPVGLALMFAASVAGSPATAAAQPVTGGNDGVAAQKAYDDYMNEKVCESITVTGSRLGSRRFCATRAEWAARRLQDRQAIDSLQTRLCSYTHSGAAGKPAC